MLWMRRKFGFKIFFDGEPIEAKRRGLERTLVYNLTGDLLDGNADRMVTHLCLLGDLAHNMKRAFESGDQARALDLAREFCGAEEA